MRKLTFAQDIHPIFERACVQCHGDASIDPSHMLDSDAKNFLLDTLRQTLTSGDDAPNVIPGDPDRSRLFVFVDNDIMPIDETTRLPAPRLPQGDIDLIREWIRQGALDVPTPTPPPSGTTPANTNGQGSSGATFHPSPPQGMAPSNIAASAASQHVPVGQSTSIDVGAFAAHPRHGPWAVTIDWGDGSTQTIQTDHPGGIGGVSHRYNMTGTYTVTTTISDQFGLSTSLTLPVLVLPS
jgi:hypothetical protein